MIKKPWNCLYRLINSMWCDSYKRILRIQISHRNGRGAFEIINKTNWIWKPRTRNFGFIFGFHWRSRSIFRFDDGNMDLITRVCSSIECGVVATNREQIDEEMKMLWSSETLSCSRPVKRRTPLKAFEETDTMKNKRR